MNNKKEKNGKLPKWGILVIIGTLLLNLIIVGLFVVLIIWDETNYYVKNNLIVEENVTTYLEEESDRYIIDGYLTNKSDKPYYDVEIEYYLYDEKDNIIGEAKDEIEKIGEGKTWNFSAVYYGSDYKKVKRIEFNEIEGN